MTPDPKPENFVLAKKLTSLKQPMAEAVTDEFFITHPDWVIRYGDSGRKFCTADVTFHMEFLAGAVEAGSHEAFGDYLRWTSRMLAARGIQAHTLDENLELLEKHLARMLLPEEQRSVAGFLANGRVAVSEADPCALPQPHDGPIGVARECFLAAILSGRRKAALRVVEDTLSQGANQADLYVYLISDALYRVGLLWEQNKITTAQEHIATSIAQYAIASIYTRMTPDHVRRGNMVVTGVAGELHQIGANLVADSMEANGWTVRFLGTNLPHVSVLATVEDMPADVLCISATIVANLTAVADLIRVITYKMKENTPRILLGGLAFRNLTSFNVGDARPEVVPDLRRALALLCSNH